MAAMIACTARPAHARDRPHILHRACTKSNTARLNLPLQNHYQTTSTLNQPRPYTLQSQFPTPQRVRLHGVRSGTSWGWSHFDLHGNNADSKGNTPTAQSPRKINPGPPRFRPHAPEKGARHVPRYPKDTFAVPPSSGMQCLPYTPHVTCSLALLMLSYATQAYDMLVDKRDTKHVHIMLCSLTLLPPGA